MLLCVRFDGGECRCLFAAKPPFPLLVSESFLPPCLFLTFSRWTRLILIRTTMPLDPLSSSLVALLFHLDNPPVGCAILATQMAYKGQPWKRASKNSCLPASFYRLCPLNPVLHTPLQAKACRHRSEAPALENSILSSHLNSRNTGKFLLPTPSGLSQYRSPKTQHPTLSQHRDG